jgi:hypothetical protein
VRPQPRHLLSTGLPPVCLPSPASPTGAFAPLVAGLLGTDYTSAQASHDLRRLRMKDIITRQQGTNTCTPTPDGMRIVVWTCPTVTASEAIPAIPAVEWAIRTAIT